MGNGEDLHAERVDWSDLELELSPHFRRTCRNIDMRQEPGKSLFVLNSISLEAQNLCDCVKPRLRVVVLCIHYSYFTAFKCDAGN